MRRYKDLVSSTKSRKIFTSLSPSVIPRWQGGKQACKFPKPRHHNPLSHLFRLGNAQRSTTPSATENLATRGCNSTCVEKVHFLKGDSRECLGGYMWWFLDTIGSMRTEERKFYYLIPLRKAFWVVGAMSPSVTRKEKLALCKTTTIQL